MSENVNRRKFENPKFNRSRLMKVAETILDQSLHVAKGEKVLIQYNPGAVELTDAIEELAEQKGIQTKEWEADSVQIASNLIGITPEHVKERIENTAKSYEEVLTWTDKIILIRSNDFPHAYDDVSPEVFAAYDQVFAHANEISSKKPLCVIRLPTKAEAEVDKIDFEKYLDMFFAACERDWEKIHQAQDILIKEILNPGEQLVLKAGKREDGTWNTDLTMSIKGQTFANETIEYNVPGSEVFSSPVRGSINGRLTIPYPINFNEYIIPNLTLTFEDGKVKTVEVDSPDETYKKQVEAMLNSVKGLMEVGEIAFGTNMAFNRPLINPLFVEKVGGSFHVALGKSFPQIKEFAGEPVNVDNGVRSNSHVDLTCIMLKKYGGGEVWVDGKLIQKNGVFKDHRLGILNPNK